MDEAPNNLQIDTRESSLKPFRFQGAQLVKKQKNQGTSAAVIESDNLSYIGGGDEQVDKVNERTYTNGTQSITVESHFVGADSIHSLIKRFLQEQLNSPNRVAGIEDSQYNSLSNTVVAASTREDVK